MEPKIANDPPKKRGRATKGMRYGGRGKNSKNKATLEREMKARLAIEASVRAELLARDAKAKAAGVETIDDARRIANENGSDQKLLKDIGAEFTRLFAGMAAFHQPHAANKNADEKKFLTYAALALQGAKDFAQYESPKLSAVLINSDVVRQIEILGGLPDDEDGSFQPATVNEAGEEQTPAPDIKKAVNE